MVILTDVEFRQLVADPAPSLTRYDIATDTVKPEPSPLVTMADGASQERLPTNAQ